MRQRVEIYPVEVPKAKRIRKKRRSEEMNGPAADPASEVRGCRKGRMAPAGTGAGAGEEEGSWILHAINSGMKRVCAKERLKSLRLDQIRNDENVQRYRPNRSPRLKRRTWSALKRSGCRVGETG